MLTHSDPNICITAATPAPWRYEAGKILGSDDVQTNGWQFPRGGITNASFSNRVCADLGNDELPGPRANIALIIATPDMLAALIKVRASILRYHGPGDFEPYESVRDALKKVCV